MFAGTKARENSTNVAREHEKTRRFHKKHTPPSFYGVCIIYRENTAFVAFTEKTRAARSVDKTTRKLCENALTSNPGATNFHITEVL